MRSAEQITRKPGEWKDFQQAERQKNLREVLAILRKARESGAEWYVWVMRNAEARRRR